MHRVPEREFATSAPVLAAGGRVVSNGRCGDVEGEHNIVSSAPRWRKVALTLALCGAYGLGRASSIRDGPPFSAEKLHKLAASNVTETVDARDAHPPVLYGHVHMAKTGGSSLNGLLANKFERVCGNKGYSYDAYADNERAIEKTKGGDAMKLEWGRAKVKRPEMETTGYEDCDYISHEIDWSWWKRKFGERSFHELELELHVPCRDPIDHLMSLCNYRLHALKCDAASDDDFYRSIDRCVFLPNRFSLDLVLVDHFAVKFESTPYVKRETNLPRNKTSECIWNDGEAYAKAERYMRETYDYYKFCDECMGSADEITRNLTRRAGGGERPGSWRVFYPK